MTGRWGRCRDRALVFGHRGASAHATENTLEALTRAVEQGADGVELDVRLCASGEVVVFHDETLERLAGRPDRIDSLRLVQLRDICLHGGGRIPSLDEVLGALGGDVLVNVEIKSSHLGRAVALTDQVVATVRARRAQARVLISSFDPSVLVQLRLRASDLQTGLLFHAGMTRPLREAWLARALRPSALHPEAVLVTASRVHRWRQRGYGINAWTVDEPDDICRLDSLGVDGLITNDPAATRSVLAQRES